MNTPMSILVADDEQEILHSLSEILTEDGYRVVCATTAAQAKELALQGIDLALLDIKLGTDDGIELLRAFRSDHPALPVIMISGHGTVSLTTEAFRLGAHDFMEKPLRLVKVRTTVRNALESVALRKRLAHESRRAYPQPVMESAVMKELYGQVHRLAAIASPVVIMGPSGSGKELVARALHYEGPRRDCPFIATNCASLPSNLAESELFGHEKGAYTGAHARRSGCLEQAHGGTLFLDEIADMDLQVQAKLLRVLETGSFCRLGGNTPLSVNVRIVAATHKDLGALQASGQFRHDLWYRLCAFVLTVPPLSQRREDIIPLAQAFLDTVCREMNIKRTFAPQTLERLATLPFAGNVRELRHLVTRCAVFTQSETIDPSALDGTGVVGAGMPPEPSHPMGVDSYLGLGFKQARDQFERNYLEAQLESRAFNITATAAAIGMAQSNLSRKLKELGIRPL